MMRFTNLVLMVLCLGFVCANKVQGQGKAVRRWPGDDIVVLKDALKWITHA